MENQLNLEDIIWIDANAVWLYPILLDYEKANKDLGMKFLSLGSLRYDEKYFVGYIYNDSDVPFEIVGYIQYKMIPSKLTLNYIERAKKYKNNSVARTMIASFAQQVITDPNISVEVTSLSDEAKKAGLLDKLSEKLKGEIVEKSKRNTR